MHFFHEPDVTLSDFALTLLCTAFSVATLRHPRLSKLQRYVWSLFFASIAFASLTGGLVHGCFNEPSTGIYQLLWRLTLLLIALTTACIWRLAGDLVINPRYHRYLFAGILFIFICQAWVILLVSQNFLVVIVGYLPALLGWMTALIWDKQSRMLRAHQWIVAGIVIGIVAALLQQLHVAIHPQYFNHNATYHLNQGVGLCLLFKGARGS